MSRYPPITFRGIVALQLVHSVPNQVPTRHAGAVGLRTLRRREDLVERGPDAERGKLRADPGDGSAGRVGEEAERDSRRPHPLDCLAGARDRGCALVDDSPRSISTPLTDYTETLLRRAATTALPRNGLADEFVKPSA
jgi:hypothetical protein